MGTYFGIHNHTMYSNIRLLDSINRPKALIDKAIELGLSGIAITDHECLSAHMEVNQYAKELKEKNPDFTIALGNEIYLTDTRDSGQKYYHFLLIAKDAIGHKALRELSSIAWYNSYEDRRMERVPTLKSELQSVMSKYKGHVIATTACIGGELGSCIVPMWEADLVNDVTSRSVYYEQICKFLNFCIDVFEDDFYLECAPSTNEDQMSVNNYIYKIAKAFDLKMVVGTDAHYLTKEDRPIHKAYLNSKGGDREVDAFYEFAHLMDENEVKELLTPCFKNEDNPEKIVSWILNNTLEIQNKISFYSLERKQIIPKVKVNDYPNNTLPWLINNENYPTLEYLMNSNNPQEKYWFNECVNGMKNKDFIHKTNYWERLETEADIIKYIGEKLDDCLFAYFNTFKHYIDLFWDCGSIVGPGRGSATGFLSNYLLGITQLDPIRWDLQYCRFLNKERAELPSLLLILGSCKKRTLTVA